MSTRGFYCALIGPHDRNTREPNVATRWGNFLRNYWKFAEIGIGFQDRCLRPLGHLSASNIGRVEHIPGWASPAIFQI
jgi:hypothetical protein